MAIAVPLCAVEAAYRVALVGVSRPVRPRSELPKAVAEALSLELTGSSVPRLQRLWPWDVAGFLAVAFANDILRVSDPGIQRRRTLNLGMIVHDTMVSSAARPGFYRQLALQMWISRNWTPSEALAAWAESNRVAERARALYGKDLDALDPGELAGVVSFMQAPSRMRRSPTAWLAARTNLLRQMAGAGLITGPVRAAADRLPLPVAGLTKPASAPVEER